MKAWPEIELGSHCEVFSGFPFKSAGFTDDPADIALVKGENIGQGMILWGISKRWSREHSDDLRRYKLEAGDVVLAMDRPWVPAGLKFARIRASDPEALLVQRVARLRARNELDQSFLCNVIASPDFVAYVKNIARGVGVPHISSNQIAAYGLRLPPLPVQRSIAAILSAYDDLIENNRRRMALLEEAARQLHNEWFVRLHFPGYEHTPIVDGVPVGWHRVPTPEAVQVNPRTALPDGVEQWSVEMADLPLNSMVIQQVSKRNGRSGSKFQNGDTLFARITPCLENGKTAFVDFLQDGETARGSTEFIVLRARLVTPEYLYCLSRTYDFRENAIKSMVGSSGRQRVQESCFDKFVVLVPPHGLSDVFTDAVRPMFHQIKSLHAANKKLRAARDLLLPRLMSGEITV